MSILKVSYHEYLMQNRNDLVWDAVTGRSDEDFLKTVHADAEGFAKVVNYLCSKEVNMSWLFDIFLDSWFEYYKVTTGKAIIY